MNKLKIKWAVSGDFATAEVFGMDFTVRPDKKVDCHRECYLIESDSTANFSEPLFTEIKAVGINSAKLLAEKVIVEFVCSELKKANEDE